MTTVWRIATDHPDFGTESQLSAVLENMINERPEQVLRTFLQLNTVETVDL